MKTQQRSLYCQDQPKSRSSLAELAIKSDSDTNNTNTNNHRGSIKKAEYQQLFKEFQA